METIHKTETKEAATQPQGEEKGLTLDSIFSDENLFKEASSRFFETDKFKEVLSNKANSIYNDRISDEVSNIHKRYDEDMFEVLGERPTKLEEGGKQKTYDKIKELYTELKGFRDKKTTLDKDEVVASLNAQIETLKNSGGGEHWKSTFEAEQNKWKAEKEEMKQQISDAHENVVNYRKQADLEAALRGLEYDENIPESARKALIDNAIKNRLSKSKIEENKVVYLNEDGSLINNNEYQPENALTLLREDLKDILKVENKKAGGGAPASINGSIERTVDVNGKSVSKLNLNQASFNNKVEFVKAFEIAMAENGITRGSEEWKALEIDARERYNVKKLPFN
jgi:hypothetical protein